METSSAYPRLDGNAVDADRELDVRLEALLAGLDAPAEAQALRPSRGAFRLAIALAFAAGVLVGWLALGWWLWPVRWANCAPWDLQRFYQKQYVTLVASELATTGDPIRARRELAGWDAAALAALLTDMEGEASGSETGRQLGALREALDVPEGGTSLWAVLLRQRPILWAGALSGLLLVAAPVLEVAARLGNRRRGSEQAWVEGDEESFAADGGKALEPWMEAFNEGDEGPQETAAQAGPALAALQEREQQEMEAEAPAPEARTRAVEKVQIQTDGRVVVQENAVQEAAAQGDEVPGALSDLFAGVVGPDPRLEVLTKMTGSVDLADLVWQSEQVLRQLRTLASLGKQEVA